MNRFSHLWQSKTDNRSNSSSTPITPNESAAAVSSRSSGATRGGLIGHHLSQSHESQPLPRQDANRLNSSNLDHRGVLQYSAYSTQGPFHSRMFISENFMLGAGAVIIQPSSGNVVIVQDGDSWFLPKGRKDLGESIEQAALREAYEESGYRCEFLPLYHWTNAPTNGSRLAHGLKHTEPLFVTITSYIGHRNRPPGEYLTFWYTCQIGPDAVRELGTGMPDEAGYIGRLVTYEEADRLLNRTERFVLAAARTEWLRSIEIDEQIREMEVQGEEQEQQYNNDGEKK